MIASVSPRRGGTSTALWIFLEALRRQGISVEVATTDDDGADRRSGVALDRFVEVLDFRVRYFPRQTRFYSASLPLANWLWRQARNYDVIHVHGLFGFVPVIAARIAHARRIPYVVSPHGMLERWGIENRRSLIKKASLQFLEGPLLKRADAIHFTSESEWRQAKELAIPLREAIFPLALTTFDEAPTAVKPDRDAATLLFLSRVDMKKGLDLLIDAVARLRRITRNLRLIIAGDGPPELIEQLNALAARFGVGDIIEWAGFVQGPAKARLFATATIFVLPSRSENFGYAVAEAMAAGLPVAVSRAVGICDLVERYGAGRVTEVSSESLARELAAMLGDPEGRKRMSEAGREAVSRELSLETFGLKMANLYRRIPGASQSRESTTHRSLESSRSESS